MRHISYREFREKLTKVLRKHARHIGIKQEEIAKNLERLLPGTTWKNTKVSEICRGKVKLSPDHVEAFAWAHLMAPYHAIREIQRETSDNLPEAIIEFTHEGGFETRGEERFISSHGVRVRYLRWFPPTDRFDIFLMSFDPGGDTGMRHQRPRHYEIAWCVSGNIELEFEMQGEQEPRTVRLKERGSCIAYSGDLAHRARERTGKQQALVYVVSIKD